MSNVAYRMEGRLSPAQINLLRRASRASAGLGVELYLVGGAVRDVLLDERPIDLDLVAVGDAPDLPVDLADRLDGEVLARSRFGTARLRIGDSDIDIVAARRESYERPGALPTVSPGSIDEDLARRDFSVNAMAVSLNEEAWGDLLDPFQGRRDLQHGVIRVLHPSSFVDDATRILRAVRYTQRMEFQIDAETERLLTRDLGHLNGISGDRIRHELGRIFREPRAASMLEAAQRLGVLSAVHPALRMKPTLLAKLPGIDARPAPQDELWLLALLAYSAPSGELSGLISRLSMDRRWAAVVRDVATVREAFQRLGSENIRPGEVYAMLRKQATAAIEGCALATDEPLVRQRLDLYLTELRHVRPILNGDDLIALGVPQGPLVGKLLEKLLTARLEGLLSTKKDEETYVLRSVEGS